MIWTRPDRAGRTLKHDHYYRLFFCLKWLNDGNFYRTRETETGWGKSFLCEDTPHVLKAIVEGLDGELQWSDEQQRRELGGVFQGIFHGCIGISDVKEFQVVKHNLNPGQSSMQVLYVFHHYPSLMLVDGITLQEFRPGPLLPVRIPQFVACRIPVLLAGPSSIKTYPGEKPHPILYCTPPFFLLLR
jgi:hypothetical protein